MQWHADLFREHNIVEPLFTSDNAEGFGNSILPGALQVRRRASRVPMAQTPGCAADFTLRPRFRRQTINFKTDPVENLERVRRMQPDRPLMVSELWTGCKLTLSPDWRSVFSARHPAHAALCPGMDHWGYSHRTEPQENVVMNLETILNSEASVNLCVA